MPDVVEEEEPVAAPKTKNGAVRSYLTSTITPVLLKGLMEMEKEPRERPVIWLAQYLEEYSDT